MQKKSWFCEVMFTCSLAKNSGVSYSTSTAQPEPHLCRSPYSPSFICSGAAFYLFAEKQILPQTLGINLTVKSLLLSVASSICRGKRLSRILSLICSSLSFDIAHMHLAIVLFDRGIAFSWLARYALSCFLVFTLEAGTFGVDSSSALCSAGSLVTNLSMLAGLKHALFIQPICLAAHPTLKATTCGYLDDLGCQN